MAVADKILKRAEVIGFLSSHRQEMEERFGVCSLALFGSMARDEAGPESDVDVLVEFRETPGLAEYMRLKFWLEDGLGRQVDLVMPKALKPWAKPLVEAEAIRVVSQLWPNGPREPSPGLRPQADALGNRPHVPAA